MRSALHKVVRFGLLSALFCSVPSTLRAQQAGRTVTVPLEVLDTGHIAVKARINGKGPFRMILDTGAPICLIHPNAARQAGLITEAQAKQPGIMGMVGMGVMRAVQVGDIQVNNINALIMDHPIVALLADVEGPLDGILGFTFFARYHMTLDYAAGTVSFSPVDYLPADVFGSILGRMMDDANEPRVIAPAALWGIAVSKPDVAPGVRVTRLYSGGAAQAAGLRVGDRLLTLDGRWTDTVNDCYEAAAFVKAGQAVALIIVRDGKQMELSATPQLGL